MTYKPTITEVSKLDILTVRDFYRDDPVASLFLTAVDEHQDKHPFSLFYRSAGETFVRNVGHKIANQLYRLSGMIAHKPYPLHPSNGLDHDFGDVLLLLPELGWFIHAHKEGLLHLQLESKHQFKQFINEELYQRPYMECLFKATKHYAPQHAQTVLNHLGGVMRLIFTPAQLKCWLLQPDKAAKEYPHSYDLFLQACMLGLKQIQRREDAQNQ